MDSFKLFYLILWCFSHVLELAGLNKICLKQLTFMKIIAVFVLTVIYHFCFVIKTVDEATKINEQLASANTKQEEVIASLKKVWEIPSDWFPGTSCLYRLCHSWISTLLPNWLKVGSYRANIIHCFWTVLVYYALTYRCTPACPCSVCRQELLRFGRI